MRYRIRRLLGVMLVLVMGLVMSIHADEEKTPSVTVTIPISISSALSKNVDMTIDIRDRDSNELLKTITGTEIVEIGGKYVFTLIYNEPGNHNYSITATSNLGKECCYADIAVLTDDSGKLGSTLVLYWQNSQNKMDKIEFGHWETETTPETPSGPHNSVILGATSQYWYVPLLVMAAGVAIAFVAVLYKRKTQKGK